jgi:small-conductance mechanosensitive channel
VYLLGGQQLGNRVRQILIWLSGFATGIVLVAQSKAEVVADQFPTGKEVFGIAPRILAAVGSGVPALVIIFGALWSAWRVLRKKNPALSTGAKRSVFSAGRLALGNVLIAAGTLVLSASGTLAGRLGEDRAFAITLLVGVSILFFGFLVASNSTRGKSTQRASQYLASAASWQ